MLKPMFEEQEKLPEDERDPQLKETMDMVDMFFKAGGYDFLKSLEEKYSCASICEVPLFYLTKDVKLGAPSIDCFTAAVEDISDNSLLAMIFLVTAFLLLFAIIGVFPLCSRDNEFQSVETDHSMSRIQPDEDIPTNKMY